MIRISSSFTPLKIFISSSWEDDLIKEELKTIEEDIIPPLFLKPIRSDLGSDDSTKLHSVKTVSKCDIILIILGVKFSSTVVDEYYQAKDNDIPILILVKDYPKMEPKLQDFFEKISEKKTYKRFTDLDNLREVLSENLIQLISEKFRQYQEIYKVILTLLDNYVFKIPKKLLKKLIKLS